MRAAATALATAVAIVLPASAPALDPGWTEPSALSVLSACPATGAPQVVFPSDSPSHATGPGAVVWGASRECAGGEGLRVAPIGAGDIPAAAAAPRGVRLRGAAQATRAPHGKILLGGLAARGRGTGEQLAEGSAAGPFAPLGGSEDPPGPLALANGYLGDVALLAPIPEAHGAEGLRLRVQRYYAAGFGAWRTVSGGAAGRPASVTAAMDYRSDVLAVWRQGDAIDARAMPAKGAPQPPQRLATAVGEPQITAVLSDDHHGIVAWSERHLAHTSVYLDISREGVRFGTPILLERFADPDGALPASAVHLVRLRSESVMMAWAGAAQGRWVLRAATIELGGPGAISTLAAPAGDALLAALATGPDDEGLALWSEPQAPASPSSSLFASRVTNAYPRGPIFGAPEQLAPPGSYTAATVAIDPRSGRAVAVWQVAHGSLEYSVGPPPTL